MQWDVSDLDLLSLEGDGARGDTTAASNTLTSGYRKQEGRSFSKVQSDRTRGIIRRQNTENSDELSEHCISPHHGQILQQVTPGSYGIYF